jgi:hydrogenase maturation protein HypF
VTRLSIALRGVTQGVGMRPFVYRAACARRLVGWVQNGREALRIEVQGPSAELEAFVRALAKAPPPARVDELETREIRDRDEHAFRIVESDGEGAVRPMLPADLATCAECAEEVRTPGARRYRYPFTNCARCGPRFTIVLELPYDRVRTTMSRFAMCPDCAAEYQDPKDRRFHAQPVACPACGPALRLVDGAGAAIASGEEALRLAALHVAAGKILAMKALGGFQLLADATDDGAVRRLRERKRREAKPFAVLFPSIESLRRHAAVSLEEERVLASPEAPIVLVRRTGIDLAAAVGSGNPWIGAMLPSTPLHALLATEIGRPAVCTSGNLSDEPMCIDDAGALERLGTVADAFLVHDREIVRPMDDSVARVDADGLVLLRRARGFAPSSFRLREPTPTVLALGGQQKSTVALAMGGEVVVSQHLGDLHSAEGAALLERTARDLLAFFGARPDVLACDLHPDFVSSRLAERLARELGAPLVHVQHHHAHVAACMAEHGLMGKALGIAWDGAGHGTDGTLWGGEFLACDGSDFRRIAHLRPFALPGGERAMREPRRAALGVLHETLGDGARHEGSRWFRPSELDTLLRMIDRSVNAPKTTSVGRLFDAVAALLDLVTVGRYEAEAAMALEFVAAEEAGTEAYPLSLSYGDPAVADWRPLVRAIAQDHARGVSPALISARFHEALAGLAVEGAVRADIPDVVLAGGCFQNARLTRRVKACLAARGFAVRAPAEFPANDGGLALGQVLVASRRFRKEENDVSRHTG